VFKDDSRDGSEVAAPEADAKKRSMSPWLVALGRVAAVLFILAWLGGFFQRGEPLLGLILLAAIVSFVAIRRRRKRRKELIKARTEVGDTA
jgi:hypothetical protein